MLQDSEYARGSLAEGHGLFRRGDVPGLVQMSLRGASDNAFHSYQTHLVRYGQLDFERVSPLMRQNTTGVEFEITARKVPRKEARIFRNGGYHLSFSSISNFTDENTHVNDQSSQGGFSHAALIRFEITLPRQPERPEERELTFKRTDEAWKMLRERSKLWEIALGDEWPYGAVRRG